MPSASEVILGYIVPALGLIMANLMYLAPLKDLNKGVRNGTGLKNLNPTPWAFLLGKCAGWAAYGILIDNWVVFWGDYPGFVVACWLNLGAVKLVYASHHQTETRTSMIHYLAETDKKAYETDQKLSELEHKNRELQRMCNTAKTRIAQIQEEEEESESDAGLEHPDENGDNAEITESIGNRGEITESIRLEDAVAKDLSKDGRKTPPTASSMNKSIRFEDAVVAQDSVSAPSTNYPTTTTSASLNQSLGLEEAVAKDPPPNSGESQNHHSSWWHSWAPSEFFASKPRGLRQRSRRRQPSWSKQKSQRLRQWGEVVWEVTSQKTPAKAPHEQLTLGIILFWSVVFTFVGFFNHFAVRQTGECLRSDEDEATCTPLDWRLNCVSQNVVGWIVVFNQVFFFGAPLSRIGTILKTRKSDALHLPTMVMNSLNSAMWVAIGASIFDPFVYAPAAMGLFFSLVQVFLYAIFPRSPKAKLAKQMSITSFVSEGFVRNYFHNSMKAVVDDTDRTDTELTLREGTEGADAETPPASGAEHRSTASGDPRETNSAPKLSASAKGVSFRL